VRVLLAAPQNGTPARVPDGGISLACALRCWAFGYFGSFAGALEEMRPQKSAAKSAGLHLLLDFQIR
jgi:hypothetical protein